MRRRSLRRDRRRRRARLREIGLVFRRGDRLVGDAGDAESNLQVPGACSVARVHGATAARGAVILGAGGAGVALASTLAHTRRVGLFQRIMIADIDIARVETVRRLAGEWAAAVPISMELVDDMADGFVESAGKGSVIVNATGLGKDRPGSPVSPRVQFPLESIVWDFNYRFAPQQPGLFLETAADQASRAWPHDRGRLELLCLGLARGNVSRRRRPGR